MIGLLLLDAFLLGRGARAGWMPGLNESTLRRIHALFPRDGVVLYALAVKRHELGDEASADELLRRAAAADPNLVSAGALHALVLVERQMTQTAYKKTEEVFSKSAAATDALVARGRLHAERREMGRAKEYAEQALQLDPANADAWLLKALAAEGYQDWSGAAEAAARATDLRPSLRKAWLVRSQAVLRQGDFRQAEQHARAALQLSPHHPDALAALGDSIRAAKHRSGEALESYTAALAAIPQHRAGLVGSAACLLKLGNRPEALARLRQVVSRWPADLEAWQLLARSASSPEQRTNYSRRANRCRSFLAREREIRGRLWASPYGYYEQYELARLYARYGLRAEALAAVREAAKGGPMPGVRRLMEELVKDL